MGSRWTRRGLIDSKGCARVGGLRALWAGKTLAIAKGTRIISMSFYSGFGYFRLGTSIKICVIDLGSRHNQMGSLAGAARLWKDSASVQRIAQREQKSLVEQKGKSYLDFAFQCEDKPWKSGLSILSCSESFICKFQSRGVRKVTTGITGLWRPSVHSDVAFWSFDVGSSYHYEAEFVKCWIVHPLIGNVSWV